MNPRDEVRGEQDIRKNRIGEKFEKKGEIVLFRMEEQFFEF